MDFIERIFGIAPDGGNGALEAAIWLIVVAAPLLLATLFKRTVFVRAKPERHGDSRQE